MSAPRRRELIPELRAMIAKGIPGSDQAVQEAIDHWRDGLEPMSPWEKAVFDCVDQVVADMDAGGDS